MVSLLEIAFTTVFVFRICRWTYRQGWGFGYKAAVYFFAAFFLFALWNRPLRGQWGLPDFDPLVAVIASIGVVIAGNWAHDRWGADWRVSAGIVGTSIGFILLFCWPFFTAGPASFTPSLPTSLPAASTPAAAASAPVVTPTPASAPVAPAMTPSSSPSRHRSERSPQQMYDECIRRGLSSELCGRL